MSGKITVQDVAASIRDIPDFPKEGILFKDITTALKVPEIFNFIVEEIYNYYKDKGITKVVGIESRGFILGSILAHKLGAGFVLVRKPGKLPYDTYSQSYQLEYGINTLHMHTDALEKDDVVLLHDDLLATGGSANAAIQLIKKFGISKIMVNFICELDFLEGRSTIDKQIDVFSLVRF